MSAYHIAVEGSRCIGQVIPPRHDGIVHSSIQQLQLGSSLRGCREGRIPLSRCDVEKLVLERSLRSQNSRRKVERKRVVAKNLSITIFVVSVLSFRGLAEERILTGETTDKAESTGLAGIVRKVHKTVIWEDETVL